MKLHLLGTEACACPLTSRLADAKEKSKAFNLASVCFQL